MDLIKKLPVLVLVLLAAPLLMGMSGFGDSGPQRIPTPEKSFKAVVVDQADVRTDVSVFSIGGYTYFMGTKGKGQLAVPFERVQRADFRLNGDGLEIQLQLRDGESVTLTADRHADCFGKTKFGNFQIKLGDVKMLTIEAQSLESQGGK